MEEKKLAATSFFANCGLNFLWWLNIYVLRKENFRNGWRIFVKNVLVSKFCQILLKYPILLHHLPSSKNLITPLINAMFANKAYGTGCYGYKFALNWTRKNVITALYTAAKATSSTGIDSKSWKWERNDQQALKKLTWTVGILYLRQLLRNI